MFPCPRQLLQNQEIKMMLTRILIPKINPPTWGGKYGKPHKKIHIQDKGPTPFLQIEEKTTQGKNVLQFELNPFNIPNWKESPILCTLIENGKEQTLQISFPQQEKTHIVIVDLTDPCKPHVQKTTGPSEIVTKGLEHALSIRSNFANTTLDTISKIVRSPLDFDVKKVITSLEEISRECGIEKTSWKKKKEEFNPSQKIPFWPKGYLREWLKMLSRTKAFHAPEIEIQHLEKNWHKWTYVPTTEEEPLQNNKEEYLICPPNENDFLFLKKTFMLCALQNRPEEILDYLWENPKFIEATKTSKTPVENLINEWGTSIPQLKGVLLPNFN